MDIEPIRTTADHKAALETVDSLMGAQARTPEGDRLDVLVTLIEAYERQHFPMDLPDATGSKGPRSCFQRAMPRLIRLPAALGFLM